MNSKGTSLLQGGPYKKAVECACTTCMLVQKLPRTAEVTLLTVQIRALGQGFSDTSSTEAQTLAKPRGSCTRRQQSIPQFGDQSSQRISLALLLDPD